MSGSKQKQYDDHELCEDIAGGILTQKQIGEKYDLSPQMVSDIARGDRRTDLKPIIDKISEGYITEVRRIARARGRKTMKVLDDIIDEVEIQLEKDVKPIATLIVQGIKMKLRDIIMNSLKKKEEPQEESSIDGYEITDVTPDEEQWNDYQVKKEKG